MKKLAKISENSTTFFIYKAMSKMKTKDILERES
jgi:hypothetical protein